MMTSFCPACSAYFPGGATCPACGLARDSLHTPPAPDSPHWQVTAPGQVATRLTLVHLAERPLLVVPWATRQPAGGGLTLLDARDGQVIWTHTFDTPIEGGAAVAGDLLIVGLGGRTLGPGDGALVALDLATHEERWRRPLAGAVRGAPVVNETCVYAATSDGALVCHDVRSGTPVWEEPARVWPRRTDLVSIPIPAAPVLFRERGTLRILVATYGVGREEGRVAAFDSRGRLVWGPHPAGGNVRGTPALVNDTLYVAAQRYHPATGVLTAFDARHGNPRWPQPVVIHAEKAGNNAGFSAGPFVHAGLIYVGNQNHRLYALDAANGQVRWTAEVAHGIATTPAFIQGLIVFGANDGLIHARDATSGKPAWTYPLGGHVLTDPLVWGDTLFVATDDGAVAALPWHLGHYADAAARLENQGQHAVAGDAYALAGHFSVQPASQDAFYQHARAAWEQAAEFEKSASLWEAFAEDARAAAAWQQAGERWRRHDSKRAAFAFKRAVDLNYRLWQADAHNRCAQALAACLGLPWLEVRAENVQGFVQWEASEMALRLTNEGRSAAPAGIMVRLAGGLQAPVTARIDTPLPPRHTWHIPVTVRPTQRRMVLEIEVEYEVGMAAWTPLRFLLTLSIEVASRPQPLIVGDVARLEVTVGDATQEGISITTQDVGGFIARGSVGQVSVQGDIGYQHVTMSPSVDVSDMRAALQELLVGQAGLADRLTDLLVRQEQETQAVIQAVTQAIETHRLSAADMTQLLAPMERALTGLQAHAADLDVTLQQDITALMAAVQQHTAVEHKLKLTLPLIPMLLHYESEMNLGERPELARLWATLKARFGRA